MQSIKNVLLERLVIPMGDLICGTQVMKQLKIHRKYNHLGESELGKLQSEKLALILNHAIKTCEAYKNIEISSENPNVLIRSFPILYKGKINSEPNEFISNLYKGKKLIDYHTSGSSGQGVTIKIDKKEESILRAILINWWEWSGYYLGKPILQTGMTPKRGIVKKFKDTILSTKYVDAFNIVENDIEKHLRAIQNKDNFHLGGYASSLFSIAEIAKKKNINVRFTATISWGDKLFDHYRKLIEEVFKTKVFENYGCNEGLMIGQKMDLPFFYIYTPSVYLELLDENNKLVQDGQLGRVIVTKLDGYVMPLIRYDTGDLAVRLPLDQYPKKRAFRFPLLLKVIGRNTDIIKTSKGDILTVHTFTGIFEYYQEIKQFQIIQNIEDRIIIKYIPGIKFSSRVLEDIEVQINTRMTEPIEIDWEEVNEILPTKSGKPQIMVNNLIEGRLSDLQ